MTTFRTGNHWGVTIVRQGERTAEGHIVGADELVAVVTNGDTALAERICALLNAAARQAVGSPRALADALDGAARDLRKGYPGNGHPVEYVLGFEEAAEFADGWATADQGTPDRSYLRGAFDALGEVYRQLERDDFNLLYTKPAVWQRLHAAARELGVDEATPARSCTCPAICPDCDSAIGTNYRAGCEGCATHIVECVGVDETTQVSASPLPPAAQQSPRGGDGGEEAQDPIVAVLNWAADEIDAQATAHGIDEPQIVDLTDHIRCFDDQPDRRSLVPWPEGVPRPGRVGGSSTESAVSFDPVSPEPVSPRPGPVPVPAGNKSTDRDGSLLRHLLIENGPYVDRVHTEPFGYRNLVADELNEFRNELLDLLILRSKLETIPGRFTVVAAALSGAPADLHLNCRQCRRWALHVGEPLTLAELSQRAEKHAEECTP